MTAWAAPIFPAAPAFWGLKDRVDALGGRIDLHSPRGGGTTLRVTFRPLRMLNVAALRCPPVFIPDSDRCRG